MRRAAARTSSSTSACRRWPTPIVRARARERDGAVLSAARSRLRRVLPRPARASTCRREQIFSRLRLLLVVLDSWLEHAARYVEMMIERFGLGADSASSRSRATTATCCSTSSSAACRCSASSRRPTSPRWRVEKGHPDARSSSSARDGATALARRGAAPTCSSATTCWRTCPTSTTSSPGMKVLLEARRRHHDRVPAPAAADRRGPVRHDLPRALLLLLVHDRRAGCSRAHGLAMFDVEELPTHGGSLRIFGCHGDDPRRRRPSAPRELLDASARPASTSSRPTRGFAERVGRPSASSLSFLDRAKRQGKRRRLRRAGEGQHAAELLRHRPRLHRVHRRPQPAQAGPVPARHAHPDPPARGAPPRPAGLRR